MPYKIENYTDWLDRPICKQLENYYDYCKFTCNFTSETMRGKTGCLNQFLHFCKIERVEEVDNKLINSWIAYRTEVGCKARTVNNHLKHIKAWMTYCIDVCGLEIPGYCARKLKRQPEEDPQRRAFSRDTVYKALCCADREAWLMIKICFDCGLRIKELQNLRLVDIHGKYLSILGKGRKRRFAILSDEVALRLEDWIKARGITDHLWPSRLNPKIPKTTGAIRRDMKKPFEAIGVHGFCPHELRHSYATDLKRLGAPTRSIQQGLGHSCERITEMYLHDLDASCLEELYHLKYSADQPDLR